MSSDIAIRVSNLSKCYQIYDKPQHRLWQGLLRGRRQFFREFWALRDVSVEIEKGETVGILGRNGSGKSTLLQLICGTLSPTRGEIEVNGRTAALLELGAGFNPEFTGRENVYVNAQILGLSQAEIDAKYNEIVAFADIGDFIDQPVKTYSSGMFVRLAFAVAISVAPDILIVDEALSVGDIAFRNKCMQRIKELHEQGVTILFVSHDLSTLQMICERVVWLNDGQLVSSGDPIEICQEYYAFMTGVDMENPEPKARIIPQQDTGIAQFIEFQVDNWSSNDNPVYNVGDDISLKFTLLAKQTLDWAIFAISIYRSDGDWVIGQTSREAGVVWPPAKAGDALRGAFVLSPNCLAPGDYRVALAAYPPDLSICYALTELAIGFSVRTNFPTWGKFINPCQWMICDT